MRYAIGKTPIRFTYGLWLWRAEARVQGETAVPSWRRSYDFRFFEPFCGAFIIWRYLGMGEDKLMELLKEPALQGRISCREAHQAAEY